MSGYTKREESKRYRPQEGDTLETIARRETEAGNPITAAEIARYNWGTDELEVVNEHLRDELGCYRRDGAKNFVMSEDAEGEGELRIPQKFSQNGLALETTHEVRVQRKTPPPPQFKECVTIPGVTFQTGTSFVRPSVVKHLQKLEAEIGANPDAKVFIFGHTDKVGDEVYNKKLSERRAESVHAFITDDAETWERLYQEEDWGEGVLAQILEDFGGTFAPSQAGSFTQAVHHYQEKRLPDEADGIAGPNTRKEMFTEYMTGKHDVELVPDQFLGTGHMGCGEFNPVQPADGACEANRRVVFYLFEADRCPVLPCKEGDVGPCHKQIAEGDPRYVETFRCSFYDSVSKNCDCETPVPAADEKPMLEAGDYLAAGAETVLIHYSVPASAGEARFELYRKSDNSHLWTRPLSADEMTPATHQIEWDGAIDPHPDFPDDYVTIEHSPYVLKLFVDGEESEELTAEFKVEVSRIELELGDKAVLRKPRDKALYGTLGVPAVGATEEVRLVSNLFKTSDSEDSDDTSFTVYRDLWGDGPAIPVFATVYVHSASGGEKVAPLALGGAAFLWDWEDVAENTSHHHTAARTFLDNALDYYHVATSPSGDNCHVDHGGKRGPGAAPVFPAQAGHAPTDSLIGGQFPFKVEAASTRTWAAFSYPWTSGTLGGKTGVLFQPSRMAGDAYRLTVYLALDEEALDVTDAPPLTAPVNTSSGVFEIWREVHLAKLIKKNNNCPGFSVNDVQDYYERAFIRVVDKMGAAQIMQEADYNRMVKEAVERIDNKQLRMAIDPAQNQYVAGNRAVYFRSYANLDPSVKNKYSQKEYWATCTYWAKQIVEWIAKEYRASSDGVTILQFRGLHNHSNKVSLLYGFTSHRMTSGGRRRTAVVDCGPNTPSKREVTIAHEMGHNMFMPHAPFVSGSGGLDLLDILWDELDVYDVDLPAGYQPDMHDEDWHHCLMGYNDDAPKEYCGLCLLRLRGWSKDNLSKTASKNSKP